MRDTFHDDLDGIGRSLVEMTGLVGSAIGRSTTALLDADLRLAESVISGDAAVDAAYHRIEELGYDLLARQQPVASDLRTIVSGLRMVSDLERMGDYATHVAKITRRRHPALAVPAEARSTILEMGQTAQRVVEKAGSVIAGQDVERAIELEAEDDVMDDLQRALFTIVLSDEWAHGMETAVDLTLLGRYYERFADHAVSVARRVIYLVTGDYAGAVR